MFTRAFIIMWSGQKACHSSLQQSCMLETWGHGTICTSNNWLHQAVLQYMKHATSGIFLFSFCPQFLSSVLPYLSQRAASHLARCEVSFQSLAFMVCEEILCLESFRGRAYSLWIWDFSHQQIINLDNPSDLAHTTLPQVIKHLTHFSGQHDSRCNLCAFGYCIPSLT